MHQLELRRKAVCRRAFVSNAARWLFTQDVFT
eukprot:SAG25_NODE_10726_length_324_cov_0.911111_1_plen_31_part_10